MERLATKKLAVRERALANDGQYESYKPEGSSPYSFHIPKSW